MELLVKHAPHARSELCFKLPDTAEVRTVRLSVLHSPDDGVGKLLVVCRNLTDFKRRMLLKQDRELLLAEVNLQRMRQDLSACASATAVQLPHVAPTSRGSTSSSMNLPFLIRVPKKLWSKSSRATSRASRSKARSDASGVSWAPEHLLYNLGGRACVPHMRPVSHNGSALGQNSDVGSECEAEAAREIEVLTTAAEVQEVEEASGVRTIACPSEMRTDSPRLRALTTRTPPS